MRLRTRHGKTTQQVLLRYAIQRGACPLFTSDNIDHIRSNLQLGDFLLSEDEMTELLELGWLHSESKSASVWLWERFWNCYGRAHGQECAEELAAMN